MQRRKARDENRRFRHNQLYNKMPENGGEGLTQEEAREMQILEESMEDREQGCEMF